MLKIRLQRVGKKHDPAFRIVLIDSARAARSGYVNEVLGFYSAKREQTKLSGEKIKEWISKGAQASDTVHNILVKEKVIKGPKRNVLPPKKKVVEDEKAKTKEPVVQVKPAEKVEVATEEKKEEPKKVEVAPAKEETVK
ncbi:MAG: 30S ribosomal protein S16 [Patescibacteria group bacterium]